MARRGERPDPNLFYDCEICGKSVAKYVAPSKQRLWPGRFCSRTCAGVWRRGENHPRWNNGRYTSARGYSFISLSQHPHSDSRGYYPEHRAVVEEAIERFLRPEEVVHHINGDPTDNRIENLMLFPNHAEHKRFEDEQRERSSDGKYAARG